PSWTKRTLIWICRTLFLIFVAELHSMMAFLMCGVHMRTEYCLTVFVAACCLLAGGCAAGGGEDPGTPAGDVADAAEFADSVVVDADADTAELSGDTTCLPTLEFVGEPEGEEYGADILMSSTQTRTINLQYSGCDNKTDVAIGLEVLNGEHVCELELQTVYTDSPGAASFQVTTTSVSGICQIQACVSGRDDACVTVVVMVMGGHMPPLSVMFDVYQGAWAGKVNAVKVRLIKRTEGATLQCADVDPRSLPVGDIDSIWSDPNDVIQFTTLPDLKTELVQNYTIVALAYEYDTEESLANPLRAWACNDTDGHVELGDFTQVTLSLVDLAPRIVGSWAIDSRFDLAENLPGQVEKTLDVVFGLLNNPVDELLLLMCDETRLGIQIAPEFCSLLYTDPAQPSAAGYTDFGVVVAGMIDANMTEMMFQSCPFKENPEICTDVYYTMQDTGTPLSDVVLLSTMTCDVEPGASVAGVAEIGQGDCRETWYTVVYRWTLGLQCGPDDPDCGAIGVSLLSVPGIAEAIQADISGSLVDGKSLQIDSHLVGLKQGALIRFAIESIILPRLFGDGSGGTAPVNCIADLVGALLAYRDCVGCGTCCDDFETAVLSEYPETSAGLARDACQALSDGLSSFLEDQLASLDVGGGVMIGTPADQPARMYDNNDDMWFDSVGTFQDLCSWDAVLDIGGFDYEFDGTFFGIRN
ncbi:MAG TPA: hypothetical protein PKG98_11115, partial [Myxococcota bacterium]|nr:hypothetical protein [Myxococcota bacterium]